MHITKTLEFENVKWDYKKKIKAVLYTSDMHVGLSIMLLNTMKRSFYFYPCDINIDKIRDA